MRSQFENLPQEVRDEIYQYCLVCVEELVPFPKRCDHHSLDRPIYGSKLLVGVRPSEAAIRSGNRAIPREETRYRCDMPGIALLSVNQSIQAEAATILFGQNTWHLELYYSINGMSSSHDFWERYAKYCRHITTRFDFGDLSEKRLRDITEQSLMDHWEDNAIDENDEPDFDGPEFSAAIHERRIASLLGQWDSKFYLMSELMDLKSLSLDIEYAFCPNGCCRRMTLDHLLYGPWFRPSWNDIRYAVSDDPFFSTWKHGRPTKVIVQGFRSKREKELYSRVLRLED